MAALLTLGAALLISAGCDKAASFRLERFVQEGSEGVPLNRILVFRFSHEVDRSSIHDETLLLMDPQGAKVKGDWMVQGSEVRFWPSLPVRLDCSDAALAPGREYRVRCVGFPAFLAVRSTEGRRLDRSYTFSFRTVEPDAAPASLFADPRPESGPVLTAVQGKPFTSIDFSGVRVDPGTGLTLRFSEALHPRSLLESRGTINILNGEINFSNDEGAVDLELDTLEFDCRIDANDYSGSRITLEPEGGFQKGKSYKLWLESLDFRDFGWNPIENTFNFIWIVCKGDSPD